MNPFWSVPASPRWKEGHMEGQCMKSLAPSQYATYCRDRGSPKEAPWRKERCGKEGATGKPRTEDDEKAKGVLLDWTSHSTDPGSLLLHPSQPCPWVPQTSTSPSWISTISFINLLCTSCSVPWSSIPYQESPGRFSPGPPCHPSEPFLSVSPPKPPLQPSNTPFLILPLQEPLHTLCRSPMSSSVGNPTPAQLTVFCTLLCTALLAFCPIQHIFLPWALH